MGCRTRANEYYAREAAMAEMNKKRQTYVDGNAVRKVEPEYHEERHYVPARKKRDYAAEEALNRQKKHMIIAGTAAFVLLAGLCCFLIFSMDRGTALQKEINSLETQIKEIRNDNDSREYEISNSADLQYVIKVATEEYGMVRSNASQVVSYEEKDSEYVQQVAAMPSK